MNDHTTWRKSSHSGTEQGDCVELAALAGGVGVRDSKDVGAGHLRVSRPVLAELFAQVRQGDC
ncbi:DUF397 domain-containing protein [Actinomadura rupiterrae]|uniref:DUF397 domain-containing protein n=1 Tax=Actinomadura rupiterrae TaxID=559627 RepID=UPI0020A42A76|nr:DUF397 domain-containing protein [Actinomadura rupiterrae]